MAGLGQVGESGRFHGPTERPDLTISTDVPDRHRTAHSAAHATDAHLTAADLNHIPRRGPRLDVLSSYRPCAEHARPLSTNVLGRVPHQPLISVSH
jgi:hypothetical protein